MNRLALNDFASIVQQIRRRHTTIHLGRPALDLCDSAVGNYDNFHAADCSVGFPNGLVFEFLVVAVFGIGSEDFSVLVNWYINGRFDHK